MVEGILRSSHLEVAVRVLESIHFVVIIAVVGIAMIAIVGLSQVKLGKIVSVEEDMNGLIVLAIAIEAARHEYLLSDGISNAAMSLRVVVVSTIANHDLAVLVVGLVREEGIVVDGLLAFVSVCSLNLERRGSIMSAPTS